MNSARAELALRLWHEHQNLYVWAPIQSLFLFVVLAIAAWNLPSYRSGNPGSTFICTLWHRAKHKFTPQVVKDIWASDQFQNRLELWTIIHALGSNTKARFENTKMLQSSSGGLPLCYALRRLSNNIQEPYRTLSLQAIDASINWWKGKPAPRASALRAPWSLSPDLQKSLKHFLCQWHLQVLAHQVPCHVPSFKTIFVKHASVLDQLCNHKQAVTRWSTNIDVECCCKNWPEYKKASLNPSDHHWVLSGSLLAGGNCRHCLL